MPFFKRFKATQKEKKQTGIIRKNIEHYDQVGVEYFNVHSTPHPDAVEDFKNFLRNECRTVLNVGAGPTPLFRKEDIREIVLDLSKGMIKTLKLGAPRKKVILADARFPPIKDNSFDGLIVSGVLQDIGDVDTAIKAARELVSKVRKRAVFVVPKERFRPKPGRKLEYIFSTPIVGYAFRLNQFKFEPEDVRRLIATIENKGFDTELKTCGGALFKGSEKQIDSEGTYWVVYAKKRVPTSSLPLP